jgi:hypothetical protein
VISLDMQAVHLIKHIQAILSCHVSSILPPQPHKKCLVCSHSAAILSISSINSSTIDLFLFVRIRESILSSSSPRLLQSRLMELFYPPLMYSMDILSLFKPLGYTKHGYTRCHISPRKDCVGGEELETPAFSARTDFWTTPRLKRQHVIWTSSTAARFLNKLHHVML